MTYATQKNTPEKAQLLQQAGALNIKIQKPYYYALVKQNQNNVNFAGYREELKNAMRKVFSDREHHFAFLEDNCCILVLSGKEEVGKDTVSSLQKDLLRFSTQLEMEVPDGSFGYSLFEEKTPLLEVKRCMERCQRAMELGPMLYPMEKVWCYQKMGAFAWLNIPQDEVETMFRDYLPMLQDEKNAEMIRTLKVYLESGMNYSLTAEKMYVHINTVRKRIDRAEQIFCIDWDDYMARMKMELMLHLLKF